MKGNLKIKFLGILYILLFFSCQEEKNNKEERKNISKKSIAIIDSSAFKHNADEFFGDPRIRMKEIYRNGEVIDTINWKKEIPFDSIIVRGKRRKQLYWTAYLNGNEVVLKYPNEDKKYSVCKAKIDSLGIKNNLIAYYKNNIPTHFRLFINNKIEVTIGIDDKKRIEAISTNHYNFKYFNLYHEGTSIPESLKLSTINNDHNIIMYFDKNGIIEYIDYEENYERVVGYRFDKKGNMTIQEGSNPSVVPGKTTEL